MGDARLVEHRDGVVQVGSGRDGEAQVVEPDPVLVEAVALGSDRAQAEQTAPRRRVDDSAEQEAERRPGGA